MDNAQVVPVENPNNLQVIPYLQQTLYSSKGKLLDSVKETILEGLENGKYNKKGFLRENFFLVFTILPIK